MGRREQDVAIVVEEVAAGRASFARAHALHRAGGEVHHVLLIARPAVARRLEDQLAPVLGPVGLRVLAPEGELPQVLEVPFAVADQSVGDRGGGRHGVQLSPLRPEQRGDDDCESERAEGAGGSHGRRPRVAIRSVSAPSRFTVMRTCWPGFRERSAKV